jgi:hypothetical protein
MAGMPEMQEQFLAMAMDGRYAGNAGAISGNGHGWPVCRKCRSNFWQWPWIAGMPETQEQLPAMAMAGRYAGPPAFPTPVDTYHIPAGRMQEHYR